MKCPLLTGLTTLPETNSSPLKIGRAPIGKDRIPTIHFQVFQLPVSFREGSTFGRRGIQLKYTL